MARQPSGFVPLRRLSGRATSPRAVFAEIRTLYFETTRQSIERDLVHAIELLKELPSEEERERATVYMEGLAQMRREWASATARDQSPRVPRRRSRAKG